MKRKAEKILALLAALLTVFFLGGFAVIANQLTLKPLLKGHRKIAGGLLVAAGVITLFGSQLVAFPIAFFFFVAGGLALMRKEQVRVQDKY